MNNMNDIILSLQKVFNKYKIAYKPRKNSYKVKLNYLLGKLEKNKKINHNLFKYFDDNIRNLKILNHELYFNRNDELYNRENILMEPSDHPSDIKQISNINLDTPNDLNSDDSQTGTGYNNIKIDENSLNKNILKIRYLNGRKLNNKLLKHDYKISKNIERCY